jgi:hypothetical protein
MSATRTNGTSHTRGEWSVCCDSYARVRHSKKYDCVSAFHGRGGFTRVASRIENPSDAALIAEAPAMLAALRGLIEFRDNGTPLHPGSLAWEPARVILARIEGKAVTA